MARIQTTTYDLTSRKHFDRDNLRVHSLAGSLEKVRMGMHRRNGSFNPTVSKSRKKFPNFEIRGNDIAPPHSKKAGGSHLGRAMSTVTFTNAKSSNVSRLSLK